MIAALAVSLLALAPVQAPAAPPLIPAPASGAAPVETPATGSQSAHSHGFARLWSDYVKAEAAGDRTAAAAALREIRRARMERNIESLDGVGLAFVGHAAAKLDAGLREEAEQAFATAVALAPGLPDAHAGLATALLRKGPLGVPASIDATLTGLSAFLATERGERNARGLLTLGLLLAAFATAWVISLALLLRRGGLLLHDIDEWLGPAHHRSASLALVLLVLLLPVATFQGWGWLPLWWLAVLLAYFDLKERALAALLLASTLMVGPLVASLEARLHSARDPLYHAALAATESVPDPAAIARLEDALRRAPEDRELVYLLGAARKRAGLYDEAAELYRQALARDPADAVARNNLANIEFVRGGYDSARARYRSGTGSAVPEIAATSYYNLSLAHLQKFEYQAYNEAKSNADRLAPGLVAAYDRWKYDSRDYAVVDLGLSRDAVRARFAGAGPDVGPASLVNRFTASLVVFALAAFLVARWRGPKAFTLHCRRCGTAFCRLCHLGQVSGGLCTQCYHLFVVRDGVSGPARNRKLAEVQEAEGRRHRLVRMLSLVSPGAGQVYAGWTLRGALLVLVWYAVLGLVVAGALMPFSEVSRRLQPPWLALAAGLVLAAVWIIANRFRPGPELELPSRPAARRQRPAAGAA